MREMKDSGIEWIGAIPQDWQLSKIGSLYTQRNEKVSDKDYQPLSVTMQGILPQLATAAKTDDGDNRKLVRVGDFAINSRSDRRGSCGISPLDGSVSLINIILTPRTAMHPGYYNWLFHTTLFADEFYKWGHGIVADLWTTRWQEMKSITVPVPEYAKQERIAAFLDAECAEIDAVLEKTRASIEEYKKLKQAVITQAVTKGVRGDRPMKDSGIEWIGEIPKEWKRTKIKMVASFLNGDRTSRYPQPADFVDDGVAFLTSRNIDGDEVNLSETKYITENKYRSLSGAKIQIDDIVFCLRGSVGKCALNRALSCGTVASSLATIRPKNIYPKYLLYFLLSNIASTQTAIFMNGTCAANLSAENVANYYIVLPCSAEQKEIADYLDDKCEKINALIAKKQQYLTEIENYKKSLIYEYVTGMKEVHPL